ncbi:MAG: carboxymuconolactone decarboxylase family protein [Candidatus Hermodarchaeota archaeon]
MSNLEQLIRKKRGRKSVRLSEPRISPLEKKEARKITNEMLKNSEWDRLVKLLIEEPVYRATHALNIFSTMMKNKDLTMRFLMFNNHIMQHSSLPERERELLILRNAWLSNSEYEWGQHILIGAKVGLSNDEINRIIEGPDAEEWNSFDSTLLQAVDELHNDSFISNATWKILAEKYNTNQLMDLVFTVGCYHTMALAMNSFGVQLEKGRESFPK